MEVDLKNNGVWETSVNELMTIFKDALLALIPIMEKAHINFKEGQQYDDYDAITEVLYEQVVINSIRWSFTDLLEIEMPSYGFEFDFEKHTAFIEVCLNTKSNQEKQYVFKNFSSKKGLFDSVECYSFGKAESLFTEEITYARFKECSFKLRYKQENRFNHKSELTVLL